MFVTLGRGTHQCGGARAAARALALSTHGSPRPIAITFIIISRTRNRV